MLRYRHTVARLAPIIFPMLAVLGPVSSAHARALSCSAVTSRRPAFRPAAIAAAMPAPGALGELLSSKLGESGNGGDHGLGDHSPDLTVRVSGDAVPHQAEPHAVGLEVIQQQVAGVAPEPIQLSRPHHRYRDGPTAGPAPEDIRVWAAAPDLEIISAAASPSPSFSRSLPAISAGRRRRPACLP
jgi:hypothetical protein